MKIGHYDNVSGSLTITDRKELGQKPERCVKPKRGVGELPGGSAVKNPPAMQEMQETWVQSLSREAQM